MNTSKVYILIMLMTVFGCKKAYQPKIVSSGTNYLVVEGVINTGADSTVIRLSRTVPLTSANGSVPETGAVVTIFTEAGNSYPLTETSSGHYSAPGLNSSTPTNYSLKILASDGKVYQSDFVPSKNSPPIDSVYYRVESNGVRVYTDTHDPANDTKYYRWDYSETYEFHSAFESTEYLSQVPVDTVLPRTLAERIYICWKNNSSSDIVINTSAKLSKDIITANPITFVASNSEKIQSRYSILVKQYALTADAYNYYQELKKNTEQLGSIFDAQPSELPGNIHCITNPSETVLGYLTAGSPSQSRIFIDNRNLPAWQAENYYAGCILDTALFIQPSGKSFYNGVATYIYSGLQMPVAAIRPPMSNKILGYSASSQQCVDCTLRGTNIKPVYWVDY